MARLKITIEDTPNPDAMKFTVNRELTPNRTRSFASADQAAADPLAAALFALPGVTNVMYVNDFVTVNKAGKAKWKTLTKQVKEVLERELG